MTEFYDKLSIPEKGKFDQYLSKVKIPNTGLPSGYNTERTYKYDIAKERYKELVASTKEEAINVRVSQESIAKTQKISDINTTESLRKEGCTKSGWDNINNQQEFRDKLKEADNPTKKILRDCNENPPDGSEGPKFDEVDPSTVQTEQPRNWLDILLKIGLGVCILVLLLMVYKLISGDSDSLLGNSKEEEKKVDKDEFSIFPGLFDEPLTLLERGDNSQIEEIDKEIKSLEEILNDTSLKNICQGHNTEFNKIDKSGNEYIEDYNKIINNCKNDGCQIDASEEMGKCEGGSDNRCIDDYITYYRDNDPKAINECETYPCKFTPVRLTDSSIGSSTPPPPPTNPSPPSAPSDPSVPPSDPSVPPSDPSVPSAPGLYDSGMDQIGSLFSSVSDKANDFYQNSSPVTYDTLGEYYDGFKKTSGEYYGDFKKTSGEYYGGIKNRFTDSDDLIEGQGSIERNICISGDFKKINERINELHQKKKTLTTYKIQFG